MPGREWRSAFFGMVRRYAWNAHSGNSEVPSTAACGVCYRPSAAGSSVQEIEPLFGLLSHAFFRTIGPLPSRNRKPFLPSARSSRRPSMTADPLRAAVAPTLVGSSPVCPLPGSRPSTLPPPSPVIHTFSALHSSTHLGYPHFPHICTGALRTGRATINWVHDREFRSQCTTGSLT